VTDFSIQDVLDHFIEQVVDILPVTGATVTVVSPDSEPRYTSGSGVVPYAREARAAAVFTFPLRNGKQQVGALDLYRDRPGPLGAEATAAARTLADVASAYLLSARARVELRESSVKSRDLALHDALTGLPNASCCSTGSTARFSAAAAPAGWPQFSSSISTGSSWSTTCTVTASATSCSSRSPAG
jgi:hypothetical protein